MKVITRKAVPLPGSDVPRVVVEVWMTRDEAELKRLEPPLTALEAAMKQGLDEHLKTGYRCNHTVTKGSRE